MKMKRNSLILVILVGIALVATGVVPLGLLQISTDTNGVGHQYRDVLGGSNANGGGDLLDSTAYVTSWTGGGNSEKVVIQGHFRTTGIFTPDFPRYWYDVTLTVDNSQVQINGITGTEWTSAVYNTPDFENGQWYPMEKVILTLTNPCAGKVHVELWGHVNDLNPSSSDDGLLAVDEGYLRSGVGSVKVQNDVVEEGTNANFYVETGFSHSQIPGANPSDAGWILSVFSPTGTKVFDAGVADQFSGTISWLVPAGSYSPSSSNIFKVVLRNELINQDDDWLFTVGPGMLAQIPDKPSFEVIEGEAPFQVGDQITVRISADKTYNPIMGFWVWVSYETSAGTTTDYVYEKAWFPASQTVSGGYADVTFTFPDTGHVRLEASTADSLNLNSGIAEMKWTVYGTDNTNNPPPPTDYTMVIIGVFILLVAFILYLKAPIPKPYNLIIALALIALGIYLIYPTLMGS